MGEGFGERAPPSSCPECGTEYTEASETVVNNYDYRCRDCGNEFNEGERRVVPS